MIRLFLSAYFVLCNGLSPAIACDCSSRAQLDSAIKASDLIIQGVVIGKETVNIIRSNPLEVLNPKSSDFNKSPMKGVISAYTVRIVKVYAGEKSEQNVVIYSEALAGMCGYPFKVGEAYLFTLPKIHVWMPKAIKSFDIQRILAIVLHSTTSRRG